MVGGIFLKAAKQGTCKKIVSRGVKGMVLFFACGKVPFFLHFSLLKAVRML